MSYEVNASSLASIVKFTLSSDTGYLGLNQIDPKARLHVQNGQILIAGQSGANLIISYPTGNAHGYIEWRNGGLINSTRESYLGYPSTSSSHFEWRVEKDNTGIQITAGGGGTGTGGSIVLNSRGSDTAGNIVLSVDSTANLGGNIEIRPLSSGTSYYNNGIVKIYSKLQAVGSYATKALSFTGGGNLYQSGASTVSDADAMISFESDGEWVEIWIGNQPGSSPGGYVKWAANESPSTGQSYYVNAVCWCIIPGNTQFYIKFGSAGASGTVNGSYKYRLLGL